MKLEPAWPRCRATIVAQNAASSICVSLHRSHDSFSSLLANLDVELGRSSTIGSLSGDCVGVTAALCSHQGLCSPPADVMRTPATGEPPTATALPAVMIARHQPSALTAP